MDKLFMYQKEKRTCFKLRRELVRMQAEDKAVRVHFSDGTSAVVDSSLEACCQRVKDCPAFVCASRGHVINIYFIAHIEEDGATAIMNDQEQTPVPLSESGQLLLKHCPLLC